MCKINVLVMDVDAISSISSLPLHIEMVVHLKSFFFFMIEDISRKGGGAIQSITLS